ncbi:MAG TPA: tripartite tricarboxylate transporter substrate-binding protein [Pseudolabrys sp.]|nr:tripartite tricarboxylate transporter substrate-binding protein [Pseudolabrys sp.]
MKRRIAALRAGVGFRLARATVALTAALTGLTAPARAQADYPNRPVQLIIAYGAGTIGDVSMRIVAEKLSNKLGKNFVVENRPGAAGVIAAKAAALAAPDGYTLFLIGNSYAISTAWFKSLPYDVVKDFVPISAVATFDFLVATRSDSKFKSMQDVIAYARANPGKLGIATLSPGTTQNLGVELLKVVAGVDVTAVPFRNSPDAVGALLRGDVDIDIDSYAPLKSLLEAGKINVIATTGRNRVGFLQGVPTVIESGIPDFDVTSWNGIAAPAGAPPVIISRLNQAVVEALQSPEAQATGRKLGMEMRGSTPQELQARLKNDIGKWSDLIEKAHIPKHD